jgi:hypothetical protein
MRASHIHPLMRGNAMHAKRNNWGMKTLAATPIVVALGLGTAAYAQSTAPAVFNSTAYSDSGVATQTIVGALPLPPQTWGPDDSSQTTDSGSNSQSTPSIAKTINGVNTYESEDDENSTDAGGTGDQANASSSSGSSSVLGGLVSWDNFSTQEGCLPNAVNPSEIDCLFYITITNLLIDGKAAAPSGNFSVGTSIPVEGDIPDEDCDLGVDSFSGELVLGNSILNSGTEQGSSAQIAMQLTGTATCEAAGLVPLYTVDYDEQIGSTTINYFSQAPAFVVPTYNSKLVY